MIDGFTHRSCSRCGNGVSRPGPPYFDAQISDAEDIVADESKEYAGLALVELPRDMVPPYFAAKYYFKRNKPLDVFEDLRVQASGFHFVPESYILWLHDSIPLSHCFKLDYEASGRDPDWIYRSLNGDDPVPTASALSIEEVPRAPRVPWEPFSILSMDNIRRDRATHYTQPPPIRIPVVVGDKLKGGGTNPPYRFPPSWKYYKISSKNPKAKSSKLRAELESRIDFVYANIDSASNLINWVAGRMYAVYTRIQTDIKSI